MERCRSRRSTRDQGVSLVEALVATTLMLLVMGALFSFVASDVRASQVQPGFMDMQQRGRVGAGALLRDLGGTASGPDAGPFAGTLAQFVAPVLPRRLGVGGDAFTVVRPDAATILSVAPGARHTTLRDPLGPGTLLVPDGAPTCPAGQPACGFQVDATLLVMDDAGDFDLFVVVAVDPAGASVRSLQDNFVKQYAAGAFVGEAQVLTYYLDAANGQLRYGDIDATDAAVVDDVVGLTFKYYGNPLPPMRPKPPPGTANCLYDAAGLPAGGMALLGAGGPTLVALPLSMFDDGPWCGSGANRYDGDLLRIRQIGVVLTVQAPRAGLRGPGPLFANPGVSRAATRMVPDYEVTAAVTPSSLGAGR